MRPAIRSTHSFHPDVAPNHREGRMASDGSGRGPFDEAGPKTDAWPLPGKAAVTADISARFLMTQAVLSAVGCGFSLCCTSGTLKPYGWVPAPILAAVFIASPANDADCRLALPVVGFQSNSPSGDRPRSTRSSCSAECCVAGHETQPITLRISRNRIGSRRPRQAPAQPAAD
jgi:hypothetical protein